LCVVSVIGFNATETQKHKEGINHACTVRVKVGFS